MKLLKIFIFGLMVILISKFVNSQWYAIVLTNTQSNATPVPFQQDIAICNGTLNIGNNFAYVNNVTLFNQINSNGSNVYFATNAGSSPNIYSWYEGQLINGSTYCDVWWINLSNGIPANSNITIYMNIGSTSANYYSQYYPYVGSSPQVISGYDNGNYTFIAYGYFNNTFDGWGGYIYNGSFSPIATSNGIEMLNGNTNEGTYILPPNNGNIPEIPLIVEEAWYQIGVNLDADANSISLFGNTSNQIPATSIGSTLGGYTPASSSSTFVQFEYYNGYTYLKSAVTNSILNETSFPSSGGTFYSYLIVNSTYAQTGYYIYNSNQVWAPLTLLDTYNINNNGYTYYNLNYNPFQYGTLEIGAGTGAHTSSQYVEWVIARAYPPNGVMPSISIQPAVLVSSVQLNPSSSSPVCPGTQTSSTVTVNLNNPNNISATVTFSCSAPSGISCSFSSSSCTTSGSSCSTTLYVNSSLTTPPGSYSITVTASTSGSSVSATYTYNVGQQISISSQQSSNFQNSYNIYITGCAQNYTLYVNNSPYCYDSYSQFQNINSLCTVSYPGSYSVYAQGCYNGTCVNSNIINLNVSPACVNTSQTIIYYGIIQLKANIQPINLNTTYGPIGNNLEFSLDYPEYILTLNITNVGNITLNNITINLLQLGNVPEILYNQIPIQSLNNINIGQLQPNQSYILQFSVLPLYIGSSSLLLSFNVNGQNIGTAQYNLIVNGPSNKSSLIVSENINYILILAGIIGSIIFLI
jgi:hypothetical protein